MSWKIVSVFFLLPRMKQSCNRQQLEVCGVLKLKLWLIGQSTLKHLFAFQNTHTQVCLCRQLCGTAPQTP